MVSLILVGTPKELNIPYFAMGSTRAKETGWSRVEFEKCKDNEFSGNAYRWVIEKKKSADIRLIQTRNYIPPKTAFYAYWLAISDARVADEFAQKFPRYDTAAQIVRLNAEAEAIAQQIEDKTRKGAFDLSRLPPDQRRGAAERFIDADQKLSSIRESVSLLGQAIVLKAEWSSAVARERKKDEICRHN